VHYEPTYPAQPQFQTPDGGIALRANYAVIGGTYDLANDVFYGLRPVDANGVLCVSWTVSAPTWLWTAPVPRPTDGEYVWDEHNRIWIPFVINTNKSTT
jgi:hypothetical protein